MLPPDASIRTKTYLSLQQRGAGILLACALSGTAWWSIRAAQADLAYKKNTFDSLTKAVDLAPGNAVFRALLAEHIEGLGMDPEPQLVELNRLTPLDSQYWIRRAFRAEIENKYTEAEGFLHHASEVDHKANPAWALMNFYFRRNQDDQFWFWINKALQADGEDVSAIFRLAWDKSQDHAFILSHIPDEPVVLNQYLNFLAATARLDVAGDVAARIAKSGSKVSYAALLAYCDRYALSDTASALPVWNSMCKRQWLPFDRLEPEAGKIITNKEFLNEPSNQAFDWRSKSVDGASVSQGDSGRGFRVEFTGSQPEDCVLLAETVPLSPGKPYEIYWESSSQSGDAVLGLLWEMVGQPGAEITGSISGTPTVSPGSMKFTAENQSAVLQLHYRRPLGSVRARGVVILRGLDSRILR